MYRWYLALILCLVFITSVYKFWALQRNSGITLTSAVTKHSPKPLVEPINKISIMTFNMGMKSSHFYMQWLKHGLFPNYVREYLDNVASIIRQEKADVVILTEIAQEMLPFEKRLVGYLADRAGMYAWMFNEDDDQVIVFFVRYIGGNAILSRYPLQSYPRPLGNVLSPFVTLNLPSAPVWVAGVYNTSKDWQTNLQQTHQILNILGTYPTILAGNFNVPPQSPSIHLLKASERFNGEFYGTLLASMPELSAVNDYIFAPPSWTLLDHRLITTNFSNHKIIVSSFKTGD